MSITIVFGRGFRWSRDRILFVQFLGRLTARNITDILRKMSYISQDCEEKISNYEMHVFTKGQHINVSSLITILY